MGGGDPGGPWKSNACDERLGSTTPKSSSHLDELCPCRWRVIPRALTHYTWGAAAAFRLLNTGGTCNSLQRGGTEALIQRALMPAGDELPKLQVDLQCPSAWPLCLRARCQACSIPRRVHSAQEEVVGLYSSLYR